MNPENNMLHSTNNSILNKASQFWLKNQPETYVKKELDLTQFTRHDMGEVHGLANPEFDEIIKSIKPTSWQEYSEPKMDDLKNAICGFDLVDRLDQVTVGNGTDEIIETVARLFLDDKSTSIIVTPTFFRFKDAASRQGSQTISVSSKLEDDFQFTRQLTDEVIKTATINNSKVLWLCHPSNPTGQSIHINHIEQMIKELPNTLIVSDEAFSRLVPASLRSLTTSKAMMHRNFVVLRSLSKADSLAGIRVGWAIGHSDTIEIFEKFRLPFNVSGASQQVAAETLRLDTAHFNQVREIIDNSRQEIETALESLENIEFIPGSQTNTILVRHTSKDLFKELFNQGILVADFRQADGIKDLGFVRITVHAPEKNTELMKALEKIN